MHLFYSSLLSSKRSESNCMYSGITIKSTKRINAMEDKIAREWYGCSWNELEYDDKELVTNEAYDRLNS